MVGLVVEAAGRMARHRTRGECCLSSPHLPLSGPRTGCSTSMPPRGTASGSASTPALTPNPGSELVQRGLREVGDPARAAARPRPMVYGKWLDFCMHVIWRSRTNGVLQIWYRVDGQREVHEALFERPAETGH